MKQCVRDGFVAFTQRFEGYTTWMYLDVKGLVTVGYGNLIEPNTTALALDWVNADGTPCNAYEVLSAWAAVKARQDLRLRGGGVYANVTTVRATPESIVRLVSAKLDLFESALVRVFPEWETWPAEAQTACLSMAWAMGPNFTHTWPRFVEACRARDWASAADNCRMRDSDNPGLRPRNRANESLFRDAASKLVTS